jgi:hypothetical protein
MCSCRGLGTQQRISQEGFEERPPTFPRGFQFNRILKATLRDAEVRGMGTGTAADSPTASFKEADQSTFQGAFFQGGTTLS